MERTVKLGSKSWVRFLALISFAALPKVYYCLSLFRSFVELMIVECRLQACLDMSHAWEGEGEFWGG